MKKLSLLLVVLMCVGAHAWVDNSPANNHFVTGSDGVFSAAAHSWNPHPAGAWPAGPQAQRDTLVSGDAAYPSPDGDNKVAWMHDALITSAGNLPLGVAAGEQVRITVESFCQNEAGSIMPRLRDPLYDDYLTVGGYGATLDGNWTKEVLLDVIPATTYVYGYPISGDAFFWMWDTAWGGPDENLHDYVMVETPEPATMALLALGGLAAIRRRR